MEMAGFIEKQKMRLFFFLLVILISIQTKAQLGYTKSEIIKLHGTDYKTEVALDGSVYISYYDGFSKNAYFFDGNGACNAVTNIIPAVAMNEMIKGLDKKYIKLSELKWKNYPNNIIITVVPIDDKMFELDYVYDSH